MCDTPEYVAISLGSSVYRVTVSLANMCVAHMNTKESIGSFVYRIIVRLSNVCDTPEYVDRRFGSFVYRIIVILSHVCDTLEYVDKRQLMVHLYIESQPGCSMCV